MSSAGYLFRYKSCGCTACWFIHELPEGRHNGRPVEMIGPIPYPAPGEILDIPTCPHADADPERVVPTRHKPKERHLKKGELAGVVTTKLPFEVGETVIWVEAPSDRNKEVEVVGISATGQNVYCFVRKIGDYSSHWNPKTKKGLEQLAPSSLRRVVRKKPNGEVA